MISLLLPFMIAQTPPAKPVDLETKWGKNIATIEQKLKDHPPKEGGTMFAGSSTVVRWDLKKYFPGKDYANVGFGGSKIAECVHFAPRIVQPFKPSTVVLACGGNDLAANVTPEQVAKDFEAFVAAVRKTSPQCRIVFLSIKPTIKRLNLREKEDKANALVKDICAKGEKLVFVDVTADLVDSEGKPKREMLVDDLLHPSHEAYLILAKRLNEVLEK